jgi:hypothetical protein
MSLIMHLVILVLGEIWAEIQIRDMEREVEEQRAK